MVQKTIFDPVTKVWSAPKESILFNPNQSVGNVILNMLRQKPEDVIQICEDTGSEVTCKQMHDRTVIMAQHLMKYKLKDTDYIAFVASNTENLSPAIYACFALGKTVIPLWHILSEKEIVHYLAQSIPKIIFCDRENLVTVTNAANKLKNYIKIYTIMDKVEGHDCVSEILANADYEKVKSFYPEIIDSNKIAAVLCSSGPTEAPKKIPKTHREIISYFYLAADPFRDYNIKFLQIAPFFWLSGFELFLYTAFGQMIRVITTQTLDSQLIVDLVRKHQITNLAMPPFIAFSMMEMKDLKPMESVRELILGGMKVSQKLGEKLKVNFPNVQLCNIYAMTEYSIIAMNMSGDYGSNGYLTKNYSAKIIDENGNHLGHGQVGELCIKNDVLFHGYHNDPESTSKMIKNGWFHTSDLAYFDEKNNLHIEGKKFERMLYQGYYIVPEKLEPILNEIDGVLESCIIGVDTDSGDTLIHAFVVADEKKGLTKEEVLEHYHSKVIDQLKIRGGCHFIEEFPKDSSGKVDRLKLRKMAEKS